MKHLFAIAALVFTSSHLFAHALWMETNEVGTKNSPHEVSIFYGEYAHGIKEHTADWYSDVTQLEIWLISPDNKKTKLTPEKKESSLVTTFTPTQEGMYTLTITHQAKDLGGDYVYQFNTAAHVRVGKTTDATASLDHEIYVFLDTKNTNKKAESVKGTVFINGKAAPKNTTIEIASPTGWVKEVKTTDEGTFEFSPLELGLYFLEASYTEDKTGEHHGKPYNHIWKCATQLVRIK